MRHGLGTQALREAPQYTAAASFDHLVGASEQRWRHGEAEHSGSLVLMTRSNLSAMDLAAAELSRGAPP
jgi:hypothetical protein